MWNLRYAVVSGVLIAILVGANQTKAQETPLAAKWWPSEWGPDDERGAANRLTPAKVLRAVQLIRDGKVYELGHVYEPGMPMLSGRHYSLTMLGSPTGVVAGPNPAVWFDSMVTGELGQVGTQFDGLGHVGVRVGDRDLFYNGFDRATFARARGLRKLGVEKVGPIVTRGVLIDVAAYKGVARLAPGSVITPDDLQGALNRQAVDISEGDVVLIRTGYGALWMKDNATYAERYPGIGMSAAQWLATRRVVLVGADNLGVNVQPDGEVPVHQYLLTRQGIYLIENMNLEQLSAERVYEFAFAFVPLKLKGAEGSPGNAIAIR